MLIRSLFCALHVYLFRMQPHLKIGNQMANLGKMVKESLMYIIIIVYLERLINLHSREIFLSVYIIKLLKN